MKNRRLKQNRFILLLFVLSAAFVIASAFYSKTLAILGGVGLFVFLLIYLFVKKSWKREYFDALSELADRLSDSDRNALDSMSVPVVLCYSDGTIIWHNRLFKSEIADYSEKCDDQLDSYIGDSSVNDLFSVGSSFLRLKDKSFSVYSSTVNLKNYDAYLVYFFEVTELKTKADSFDEIKPSVIIGMYDNFDEMFRSLSDSELSELTSSLDKVMSAWFAEHNSVMRKLSSEKFVVTCHEKDLKKMIENKFSILTQVRNYMYNGKPCLATVSAGVGRGESLKECDLKAKEALNMALGRGGDQVAVTMHDENDKMTFFGGVVSGGDRGNKIASRVVANEIKKRILSCENCLILGHKFSDYDAMGTAIGLYSMINYFGKDAAIIYDHENSLCEKLVKKYVSETGKTPFVDRRTALQKLTDKTLVFLVDTHRASYCEAPDVVNSAENVIIIDHHRKSVDYLNKAVISHINANVSSASEMLTELLPYMADKPVIGPSEADALLAGIILDTKNFILRSGVSTFEAASYLKSMGADSVKVKKLFSTTAEEHKLKSDIVASAFIYRDCAISVADIKNRDCRVITAQAADELLNITGVKASFVLFRTNDIFNISARSLGEINVQLVMEKLGGGGHLTMAAAQIKSTDSSETLVSLKKAIDNYFDSL